MIQNRALWQEEPERPLPGAALPLHLVHDEAGTVYCYDTVSDPPVRHRMAYVGYEKDRGTLKYRCPARHEGCKVVARGLNHVVHATSFRLTLTPGRPYALLSAPLIPCWMP